MEPVLGKPSSKDSYLTDLDFIVDNYIMKLDVLVLCLSWLAWSKNFNEEE